MVLYTSATKKKTSEIVENGQLNQKTNCDISEIHEEAVVNGFVEENKEDVIKTRITDTVIKNENTEASEVYRNGKISEPMEVDAECVTVCNGGISDSDEIGVVGEKSAIKNNHVYRRAMLPYVIAFFSFIV